MARVQEEIAQPQPVRPGGDVVRDFAESADSLSEGKKREKLVEGPTPLDLKISNLPRKPEKLVDAPTPSSLKSADSDKFPATRLARVFTEPEIKEEKPDQEKAEVTGLGVNGIEDEMKTVSI